jgi:hypothetical protein
MRDGHLNRACRLRRFDRTIMLPVDRNGEQQPIAPKPGTPKRRRTDTPEQDEQQKRARKKALRACLACQKAHLTCDDGLWVRTHCLQLTFWQ